MQPSGAEGKARSQKPEAKPLPPEAPAMSEPEISLADLGLDTSPDKPVKARKPYTPWILEAAVLPIHKVFCACGSQQEIPSDDVMARFRHKQDKTLTWEVAQHPSLFHPSIPKETKELHPVHVRACPECWQETSSQACLFQEL